MVNACRPLAEYSWLVAEIQRNNVTRDEDGVSSAIDRSITAMPEDFLIKPFLEAHRLEVKGMLLAEYNHAEVLELTREEGREEEREEERVLAIRKVMKKWLIRHSRQWIYLIFPAQNSRAIFLCCKHF